MKSGKLGSTSTFCSRQNSLCKRCFDIAQSNLTSLCFCLCLSSLLTDSLLHFLPFICLSSGLLPYFLCFNSLAPFNCSLSCCLTCFLTFAWTFLVLSHLIKHSFSFSHTFKCISNDHFSLKKRTSEGIGGVSNISTSKGPAWAGIAMMVILCEEHILSIQPCRVRAHNQQC